MGDTFALVVDCIAAVTRYPENLLLAESDLESDLGIDSVKRVEILNALGERCALDLQSQQGDASVRTIGDIATWIDKQLSVENEVEPPVADFTSPPDEEPKRNGHDRNGHAAASVNRLDDKESRPTPAPHSLTRNDLNAQSSAEPTNATPSKRVVLVTGSGRGIGKSIVRAFAAQGDTVIVNSFHSREEGDRLVAEINAEGGDALHLWGSVANPDHVAQIFEEIERRFGYLDVLVCNASDGRIGPFLQLDAEDWDRAFRTNISGHHQCSVRAAKLMQRVGGGSIITMSAVGAHHHVDGLGSQGVVKAAVESLTKYLAGELASFGVRVNCIVSGPVYGELLSSFENSSEAQQYWETVSPDRELANSTDIVNVIEFITSEKGSSINGAIWTVDHGFSSQLSSDSLSNHVATGGPIGMNAQLPT